MCVSVCVCVCVRACVWLHTDVVCRRKSQRRLLDRGRATGVVVAVVGAVAAVVGAVAGAVAGVSLALCPLHCNTQLCPGVDDCSLLFPCIFLTSTVPYLR